ncbi:MAG: Serine/threonine protein kinase [bacterium]|nr:Serine/threonine protein kinase [bacterium]
MNDSASSDDKRDPDPFRVLGRVVAKHRILRLIGEGGMGAVYEGEHVDLAERRALKFCHVHANPTTKQRAVNEARIGASVRHPAICLVYDFEWGPPDGTTPVVVMELLQGRSLIDDMIKSRRLPWEEVFRLMSSVCDGLEAAHAQGIVHRDIKPDNIFLTASGPKIVDFGIAKLSTQRVTRTGMTLFTPLYASPEQITNSKTVDARSDIYSCGVILYHSISGERMFPDRQGNGLIIAILQERPFAFRDVAPFVPDHVAAVIDRCVAKEPSQRYQSAAALKAALEAALAAGAGPLRAGSDQRTLTPPPSEAPTAQLRPGRDPAAPRELMPTAAGKAAAYASSVLAASTARPERENHPQTPATSASVSSSARAAHASTPALVPRANDQQRSALPIAPARARSIRSAVAALAASAVLIAVAAVGWMLMRRPAVVGTAAPSSARSIAPSTPASRVAAATRAQADSIPTRGHVRVVTTPAGAAVLIAGHIVGHAPVDVVGEKDQLVRVRLELEGYTPRDDDVMPSVEGGEADFTLQPAGASPITTQQRKHRRYPSMPTAEPHEATTTPKPVLDENAPVDPFR